LVNTPSVNISSISEAVKVIAIVSPITSVVKNVAVPISVASLSSVVSAHPAVLHELPVV